MNRSAREVLRACIQYTMFLSPWVGKTLVKVEPLLSWVLEWQWTELLCWTSTGHTKEVFVLVNSWDLSWGELLGQVTEFRPVTYVMAGIWWFASVTYLNSYSLLVTDMCFKSRCLWPKISWLFHLLFLFRYRMTCRKRNLVLCLLFNFIIVLKVLKKYNLMSTASPSLRAWRRKVPIILWTMCLVWSLISCFANLLRKFSIFLNSEIQALATDCQ